jgi:hypothetical protein
MHMSMTNPSTFNSKTSILCYKIPSSNFVFISLHCRYDFATSIIGSFKYYLYIIMAMPCIPCTLLLRVSTTLLSLPLVCFISKSYSLRNFNHLLYLAFKVFFQIIFQTTMVYPQLKYFSHKVVPPHLQVMPYGCQL